MARRWWVIAVASLASIPVAGLGLNGNTRYQEGVGRVSGYSVAATFSDRPIVFGLFSGAQAWLPEQVILLAGQQSSWARIEVFEASFRLVAALAAAGAALLLWWGLARVWGSATWLTLLPRSRH